MIDAIPPNNVDTTENGARRRSTRTGVKRKTLDLGTCTCGFAVTDQNNSAIECTNKRGDGCDTVWVRRGMRYSATMRFAYGP